MKGHESPDYTGAGTVAVPVDELSAVEVTSRHTEREPAPTLAAAVEDASRAQQQMAERNGTVGTPLLGHLTDLLHEAERSDEPIAVTVVCGTDAEKTALIAQLAECVAAVSVGACGDANRTLVVTADSKYASQLAQGDKGTILNRLAPHSSSGTPYHYNQRGAELPQVAVAPTDKLPDVWAGSRVPLGDYGLTIYDSGSEPADPAVVADIREHTRHTCINVVTAPTDGTPYSEKYPEAVLEVIAEHSVTEAIESGGVNGVELYTVRTVLQRPFGIGTKGESTLHLEHEYNERVLEGIVSLVEQGRRVGVLCQVGQEGAHANYLVGRLLERNIAISVQDGLVVASRSVTAAVVNTKYNKMRENTAALAAFNGGDLDVVASTNPFDVGGGTAYPDALVIATRGADLDMLRRVLASATAPDNRFGSTIVLEFLPVTPGKRHRSYSVHELFGRHVFTQGLSVGGYCNLDATTTQHPPYELPASLRSLVDELDGMLVRPSTLAHATRESMTPPTSQVTFDSMYAPYNDRPAGFMRLYLKAHGFVGGKRIEEIGGRRTFVTYYDATAEAFLAENPPPLPAQVGEMTRSEIVVLLGCPLSLVEGVLRQLPSVGEVERLNILGDGGRVDTFLDGETTRSVITEIADPPIAEDTDVTPEEAGQMLGCGTGFVLRTLQRHWQQALPKWSGAEKEACLLYMDEAQLEIVTLAYSETREAGEDDVPLRHVTRAAGMWRAQLIASLPLSHAVRIADMRRPNERAVEQHIPGALARAIMRQHNPDFSGKPAPWQEREDAVATASPAFPAGERPYVGAGRLALAETYIPDEEAFLRGLRSAVPTPAWRPRPSRAHKEQLIVTRRVDMTATSQKSNGLRHPDDAPGEWQPAAAASHENYISSIEELDAGAIAARLGIAVSAVHEAIGRIDGANEALQLTGARAYRGNILLTIREQLMGVPLEHIARVVGAAGVANVATFLLSYGYQIFDNTYASPGAAQFAYANAGALLHTRVVRTTPRK